MEGFARDNPICIDDDDDHESPAKSWQRPGSLQDKNSDGPKRADTSEGRAIRAPANGKRSAACCVRSNGKAACAPLGRAEGAKRPRSIDGNGSAKGLKADSLESTSQSSNGSIQMPFKLFTTQLDEENGRTVGEDASEFRRAHSTLREMLGFDNQLEGREMRWLVCCNYLIDFEFLMETAPELLSCPTTIFFYGAAQSSPEPWRRACTQMDGSSTANFVCLDPSATPRSSTNPLPVKIPWGVHHTKMFLIGYSTGIRVIIHTANLTEPDTRFKAQGAYIQDFPFKQGDLAQPCQFQKDLISYIDSYRYRTGHCFDGRNLRALTRELRRYDFSCARAVLIPSIPGMHCPTRSPLGLLKLREAIREHASSSPSYSHVVCQFSSIGSLSVKWLKEQFLSATTLGGRRTSSSGTKANSLSDQIKLVYPTVEEIRTSVEGYRGGGSVPGTTKNLSKDFLQPLYCKWSSRRPTGSNPFRKSRNVPHIKSYYQLDQDNYSMKWFLLTSHNMSRAAWGELRNGQNGRENFIAHWELGVFFSPELMGAGLEGRFIPIGANNNQRSGGTYIRIPLPYELVPSPYSENDRPWAVDGEYSLPDEHGWSTVSGPGQAEDEFDFR